MGPKGEDPQYIYIEDLVDTSNEFREGHGKSSSTSSLRCHARRPLRRGSPLAVTYRDFSVSVGEDLEAEVDFREKTNNKGGKL